MKHTSVQFLWQTPAAAQAGKSGVCLHGHTLHSKECLSFLPRYLDYIPGASLYISSARKRGNFSRSWWTPPLPPAAALGLESGQIARLGLSPMVSLTDHDDIEAGMALQVAHSRTEAPVSVEWTVPFAGSIFHLGVHNLPVGREREWMAAMLAYTECPSEWRLTELLELMAKSPEVLIVLNHPFWLEEGITDPVHRVALRRILRLCGGWFHAFELNGTRPWKENRDTIALAARHGKPVISGGDRHACEPSACINLTNAAGFAEFVAEIRDGYSRVTFLPQYREPMAGRVLSAIWDILRPYPEYPDRARWTDRVFYQDEDGVARPLSIVWRDGPPLPLRGLAFLVELFATTGLRSAVRLLPGYAKSEPSFLLAVGNLPMPASSTSSASVR
jgi:hypothetical protein